MELYQTYRYSSGYVILVIKSVLYGFISEMF